MNEKRFKANRQQRSYHDVHAELAAAQKSRKGGPAYSVYVNRPMGRRAAALAHLAGATPDQVTGVSACFSFAGIALLALGPASWFTGVGVAVLLVVGYALDAADGQLARLRGGGSLGGEWLDHVVDSGKVVALHGAVAVHWYRAADLDGALLLVPLGYGVVATVLFFAQLLNDQLRRGRVPVPPSSNSDRGLLRSLVKLPHDYGLLCLVFVLLGAPEAFALVYAAFFFANVGYFLLAAPKWFREMRSLDSAGAA